VIANVLRAVGCAGAGGVIGFILGAMWGVETGEGGDLWGWDLMMGGFMGAATGAVIGAIVGGAVL